MSPLANLLAQTSSEPTSLSPLIITWVFLGLVLGFIGNNFLSREVKVSPVGILVGVFGALLGGIGFCLIHRDAAILTNAAVTATVAVVLMLV